MLEHDTSKTNKQTKNKTKKHGIIVESRNFVLSKLLITLICSDFKGGKNGLCVSDTRELIKTRSCVLYVR